MRETKPTSVASFWLLAAHEDEALFSAIVQELAERHGAPNFHPHLTILGNVPMDAETLGDVTRRVAQVAPRFSAEIADIVTGEAFYRSFYARFALLPELVALRAAAEQATGITSDAFMPHVSLLYGAVPPAAKEASAAEIRARLKGRLIRFDRVVVTNSADDVPIKDWRVVHACGLGEAGG